MKNRKVTLTLFPLKSGAKLYLQTTGSRKGFIGWTNFIDADNSDEEYENRSWSKDEAATNLPAVNAINKMIEIEANYQDGKITKDKAVMAFKTEFSKWLNAHKAKNPGFYVRPIIGLTIEDHRMNSDKQ